MTNRPLSTSQSRLQQRRPLLCRCEASSGQKKVVVLGGTGRVGSATAASLIQNFQQYDITVASRSQESFNKILELRPGLKGARFAQCDIQDKQAVKVHVATRSTMTNHTSLLHPWHRLHVLQPMSYHMTVGICPRNCLHSPLACRPQLQVLIWCCTQPGHSSTARTTM